MNIKDIEITKYYDMPTIGTLTGTGLYKYESGENETRSTERWFASSGTGGVKWGVESEYIFFNEPSIIQDKYFYYGIYDTNFIIGVKNNLPNYTSYTVVTYQILEDGTLKEIYSESSGSGSGFVYLAFIDTTLNGGNLKYGFQIVSEENKNLSKTNPAVITQNNWWGVGTFNYNMSFWKTVTPITPTPIEPNKPEGNEGDYDDDSDEIEQPTVPTITPINNGMIHAYSINTEILNSLANYLWSTDFYDNFVKVFDNPIDALLGLYQLRYPVNIGTTDNIRIGNCNSEISAPTISNNYSLLDCGTITLKEYFGNALDYSPYTKLSIYLPYVGFRNLDIDYCMNAAITVRYLIDCVSGTGVCYVYVSRDSLGTKLQAPLYSYPCSCNVQIPLTAYNMSNLYSSIVGGISSIVGGALTGGVGGFASGTIGAVNSVLGAKNYVEKSGSISGASGLLGVQKPFLVIERPINAYAKNYNKYYGLPSNMEYPISRMSGFTKVSKINLDNLDKATSNEKKELENILKEGVYF